MTEADFQRTVIEMAQRLGWKVAHFRPAKTEKGWRTAVAADGKGFPDLVLVRDRVLFVELKTDTGKLTPEQQAWGDAIGRAMDVTGTMLTIGQIHPVTWHVWRPRWLDEIELVLRRSRAE